VGSRLIFSWNAMSSMKVIGPFECDAARLAPARSSIMTADGPTYWTVDAVQRGQQTRYVLFAGVVVRGDRDLDRADLDRLARRAPRLQVAGDHPLNA